MLANSSLRIFSFKKFVDYKKKSLYLQPNYNLTSNIKACGYKYTYMETEGGHIWRNWRVYLTEFAQKIFK